MKKKKQFSKSFFVVVVINQSLFFLKIALNYIMEKEKLIQISAEQILTHPYNKIKPNEVLIFQHKGTLRSLSWQQRHSPQVLATQEAEVRGHLDPGAHICLG